MKKTNARSEHLAIDTAYELHGADLAMMELFLGVKTLPKMEARG